MKTKTKRRRKCRKCKAYCDGKPTLCDLFSQNTPPESMQRPEGWPMPGSLAMAVSAKQMKLARKLDYERGVPPTEYKPDARGHTFRPVFTSENHKRRFIKAHGYHDNNAFL